MEFLAKKILAPKVSLHRRVSKKTEPSTVHLQRNVNVCMCGHIILPVACLCLETVFANEAIS